MQIKDTKDVKWTPVVGYEDLYLVSTNGKVYSIRSHKILAPRKHNAGYLRVTLSRNGKRKDAYIHRLMCEAFFGTPNDGRNYVNHLDENPAHNQITNLEWTTNSDNIKYSWARHREERTKYFQENPSRKIGVVGIDKQTKEEIGRWDSMSNAARDLGIHVSGISYSACSNGRRAVQGIIFYKLEDEEKDEGKQK